MAEIKNAIIGMLITVWSMFNPIKDFMLAMLILFALNYVFGLICDIAKGGRWQWNKSWRSFGYATMFFLCAAGLLIVGKLMHAEERAVTCVSYVCWWAIYVFGLNISRNGKEICKGNEAWYKFFSFIYYVLSMEVVKKVPYLREFNENENENTVSG